MQHQPCNPTPTLTPLSTLCPCRYIAVPRTQEWKLSKECEQCWIIPCSEIENFLTLCAFLENTKTWQKKTGFLLLLFIGRRGRKTLQLPLLRSSPIRNGSKECPFISAELCHTSLTCLAYPCLLSVCHSVSVHQLFLGISYYSLHQLLRVRQCFVADHCSNSRAKDCSIPVPGSVATASSIRAASSSIRSKKWAPFS